MDGRSRFQAIAKPLLTRLPEGTYRAAVMDAFGAALHLTPDVLDAADVGRQLAPRAQSTAATGGVKRKTPVQRIINVALHYPARPLGPPTRNGLPY